MVCKTTSSIFPIQETNATIYNLFRRITFLVISLFFIQGVYATTSHLNKNLFKENFSLNKVRELNSYIDKAIDDRNAINKSLSNCNTNTYHLFSHGRSGELLINGTWLNAKEIATFLNSEYNIQNSIILYLNIYGCEFAKGEKGRQAVAYLEKTLGIKVNASTNITGKDGDWLLEVGNIKLHALKNYPHSLQTEICDNGIDDDNDGYIDQFDADCNGGVADEMDCIADAPANSNFSIKRDRESATSNIAVSANPIIGDLDGDGMPEIIAPEFDGGIHIFQGDGSDFADATKDINMQNFWGGGNAVSVAIADVDNNGKGELIVLGRDQKVYVFKDLPSATQLTAADAWMVSDLAFLDNRGFHPKVHDIDEDGVPEIIVGNGVFQFGKDASGTITSLNRVINTNSANNWGESYRFYNNSVVIIDIIPNNPGKELVAGGAVYGVDLTNGALTVLKQLNSEDGVTAVADLDLDGDLDIAYYNNPSGPLRIWDPNDGANGTLLTSVAGSGQSGGMPFIANIYDDTQDGHTEDYPEVVFLSATFGGGTGKVEAVNLHNGSTPIWEMSSSDDSGETVLTAYDFNGDGIDEIVFRDETHLTVFNGNNSSPTVLAQFGCLSQTWADSPSIADVDNDGHAEIVGVCAESAQEGRLVVFESDGDQWQNSRKVWNQMGYRYTAINDDLSIPAVEQNTTVEFPEGTGEHILNTHHVQMNPDRFNIPAGKVGVADGTAVITSATYDCDTKAFAVNYNVVNNGLGSIGSGTSVSFYDADPTVSGAQLLSTTTLNAEVGAGDTENFSATATLTSDISGDVFIVFNDVGTNTLPLVLDDLGDTGITECDYSNNIDSGIPTLNNCFFAIDDTDETPQNVAVTTDIFGNDMGVETDTVLTFDATSVNGGTITLNDNGTSADTSDDKLVYTPALNFTGTDTYTYTICNTENPAVCSTATVTITVLPDADGDNIIDTVDIDDDNDGILDLDENCTSSTIVLVNGTSPWPGTVAGTTVTIATTQTNANVTIDGPYSPLKSFVLANQQNFEYDNALQINPDADDNQTVITYTFSQAIPIEDFGLFIEDIDRGSPVITITVAGGTATTEDVVVSEVQGNGETSNSPAYTYNGSTGIASFSTPPSSTERYAAMFRGNGSDTMTSFTITIDDLGNSDSGDNVRVHASPLNGCDNDFDDDGIVNSLDLDSDGDGCPDAIEGGEDYTSMDLEPSTIDGGNTIAGYTGTEGPVQTNLGTDSNTDGTPNLDGDDTTSESQAVGASQTHGTDTECCTDAGNYDYIADGDGDNVGDDCDLDDDNDGIPDTVEGTGDSDEDTIADSLDLDSDNDGIPDLVESGISASEIASLDTDGDGRIDTTASFGTNGIADVLEIGDTDGGSTSSDVDYDNDGTVDTPQDTNEDTTYDYVSTDSDGDSCPDALEGAASFTTENLTDSMNLADADEGSVDANGIPTVDTNNVSINASTPQATNNAVVTNEIVTIDSVTPSETGTVCEGTDFNYMVNASGMQTDFSADPDLVTNVASSSFEYTWYESADGGTTYTEMSGETASTLSLTDVAYTTPATMYKVELSSANNSCPVEMVMTLDVKEEPVAEAGPAREINCDNLTVSLNGTGSSTTGVTYMWATADGAINSGDNTLNPVVSGGGTYTLTVTSADGCTATDTVLVLDESIPDCDGDGTPNGMDTDPNDPCEGGNVANVDLSDMTSAWYTADCDGDGQNNGSEVDPDGDGTAGPDGTDPADPCSGGSLANVNLMDTTSDWYTADCDGDGVTNGIEVDPNGDGTAGPDGTDPADPCDFNADDVTGTQSGDWADVDCDGDGTPNGMDTDPNDACEGGDLDNVDLSDMTSAWYTADCDGDGQNNGSEVDPDGDGTAGPDGTDPADPCSGGNIANIDLSDKTSDWYTADCDGDGVTNGIEVDPNGDGTAGPDGTDYNDPCDFNADDVTGTQSGAWADADCDGDGTPNGMDTDPNDACEGGDLDNVDLSDMTSAWYTADCDGDGQNNGSEVDPDGDGMAGPDGTDPADPCSGGTLANVDLTDTTSDWYTADCDGDGVTNGKEVDPDGDGTAGPDGTDYNDPCEFNADDVTEAQSGAWADADCDGDGTPNGMDTDPNDACEGGNVANVDLNDMTSAWYTADCDGDGQNNGSEVDPDGDGTAGPDGTDPADPCSGGSLANVDLTDTTSDWYTADCDGDGVTNGIEVDPDGDGTAGPDGTDYNDPCDFNADDVTGTQSGAWANADCDGDGTPNGMDTDPNDACEGGNVANVDLSDKTSAWYTADCDGDGQNNGSEVDPDGDGTAGPDGTDPADPCSGGSLANVDLTDTTSDWYTADCDGDGVINGTEVDPDGDGTAGPDGTDYNDPCEFNADDVTEAQSGDWADADCDGDGTPNGMDTDPNDACEGGNVANVDLSDMTSAWYTADCDGDGQNNGSEVDPDGDGTAGPDGTDPADPCSGGSLANVDLTDTTSDWYTADCDGDGVINGTEVDPDGDGTAGPDGTDFNDPCEFNADDVTEAQSGDWADADCDGDGTPNGMDTDPNDPCEGGDLDNVDLTDMTSAWYTADCDDDGQTNGSELDPDGDGTAGPDGTDPADPCSGGNIANIDLSDKTSDWYTADCDGDGVINGTEVDPDGDGTAGPDGTDYNDPCEFNADDVTGTQSGDWADADCDGDGTPNGMDTDPNDPCEGGDLDNVDLNDMTSAWYTADCDGDGQPNGSEVDPDGDGTTGPDGTDPADPCSGGNIANIDLSDKTSDWYTADCDGDGVINGTEVDPDGDGTAGPDGTDFNDPCEFNADDVTEAQSGDWADADCDGDGVSNGDEVAAGTDLNDPCEGGDVTMVDLTDMTSAWYTADCDGDGQSNGSEVDPDGDGTAGPDGTDPADPCSGGSLANIDLTDTTSDWYTADCDGDGVINGTEVDPDGDGTAGPDGTDFNDPCEFNADDVTGVQSGDWADADCDGDGVSNGDEVAAGTDLNDPCEGGNLDNVDLTDMTSAWYTADCDGDGQTNGSELDPDGDGTAGPDGTDPADPCSGGNIANIDLSDKTSDWYTADCDGDGVINGTEVDPDGDGTAGPDGTDYNDPCEFNADDVTEAQSGDWADADCDGDGTPNGMDTDPNDPCEGGDLDNVDLTDMTSAWYTADCDGDGQSNGSEVDPDGDGTAGPDGTDPADPCSGGSLANVDLTDTTSDWYTADCDGDGVINGTEVDPDGDGTAGPDGTDYNDPCEFNADDVTEVQSGDWADADCDGDGTPNGMDTDPNDPCEGGDLDNVDLTDMTSAWYTADCDGDGQPNGSEVDPDGDGTAGPDGTDPADPCSGGSLANVDLTDTTSDWYTADCDGDGVTNGMEVDPDGDGTAGPDGTDYNDPCEFNADDVTEAQSGDWANADCDGDGVSNGDEVAAGTDPNDPCEGGDVSMVDLTDMTSAWYTADCDGDGQPNGSEVDPDGDGTAGPDGTDPADPCSGGSLANVDLTDTTSDWYTADCDGDGVTNGMEVDPDGDGTAGPDGTDYNDPCEFNADDVTEAQSGDWADADCDGDGVSNGDEIAAGTDPNDPCEGGDVSMVDLTDMTSVWYTADCDGDGQNNGSEVDPDGDGTAGPDGTDPADPCSGGSLANVDLTDTTSDWYTADCDGDGVTNGMEVDPDGDGTAGPDGTDYNDPCEFNADDVTEAQSGDWADADCDGDGVSNGDEVAAGTDPNDPCEGGDVSMVDLTDMTSAWYTADCDGDGQPNGSEVDPDGDGTAGPDGTDPADPCSGGSLANVDLTDTTSDWYTADCDGDGETNGVETANGKDPNDPCSNNGTGTADTSNPIWQSADCDGDGVTNGQEVIDETNPEDPCSLIIASQTETPSDAWNDGDCDEGGVTNGQEVINGTNPFDSTDDSEVEVHNVITPNGDGNNDVFIIEGLQHHPSNTVQIYNRWGVLVYDVKGYNNADRAFKGYSEGRVTVKKSEALPVGTYFYVLKYKHSITGEEIATSGYLYIQR